MRKLLLLLVFLSFLGNAQNPIITKRNTTNDSKITIPTKGDYNYKLVVIFEL